MGIASKKQLAGPISFDPSVLERDALIREDNDGVRIDDAAVRDYVDNHKTEIFQLQSTFFSELRDRLSGKTA